METGSGLGKPVVDDENGAVEDGVGPKFGNEDEGVDDVGNIKFELNPEVATKYNIVHKMDFFVNKYKLQ